MRSNDAMGFTNLYARMTEEDARGYVDQLEQARYELARQGKGELALALHYAIGVARDDRDMIFREHAWFERVG